MGFDESWGEESWGEKKPGYAGEPVGWEKRPLRACCKPGGRPTTPATASAGWGVSRSVRGTGRSEGAVRKSEAAVSVACMKSIPVALQCVLLMITIRNYESSGFGVSFCCFLWPVRP